MQDRCVLIIEQRLKKATNIFKDIPHNSTYKTHLETTIESESFNSAGVPVIAITGNPNVKNLITEISDKALKLDTDKAIRYLKKSIKNTKHLLYYVRNLNYQIKSNNSFREVCFTALDKKQGYNSRYVTFLTKLLENNVSKGEVFDILNNQGLEKRVVIDYGYSYDDDCDDDYEQRFCQTCSTLISDKSKYDHCAHCMARLQRNKGDNYFTWNKR